MSSLSPSSPPFPFENKGLVLKKDPSQLAPGEFYQIENLYSSQEGAITPRTGHERLTPTTLAAACVSIAKLNNGHSIVNDASNPRYLGCGTDIFRTDPSFNVTSVATGLTTGVRWGAQQYNSGTAGTPAIYFASQDKSLRDNSAGYATLQNWGIDPPPIPVTATVNIPGVIGLNVDPSTGPTASTPRFVPGYNSDGSGNKTISAIGVAGYTKITPTAGAGMLGINGIFVGMLLTVTDTTAGNETIIVLAVDSLACYGITTINHNSSPTANVTLSYRQNTFAAFHPTATYYFIAGSPIDASFNGVAEDGYSTNDCFHIALDYVDDPVAQPITDITQIRIIWAPNFTGVPPPIGSDYYEYIINPAASMATGTTNSPAWLELNIPKNTFTKVGNAGSGAFTWKNLQSLYIEATCTVGGGTLGVSSMYFVGGGGLNSSAPGTLPYDWLYTFRNPITQQEGNPCVAMATANLPPPINNGKVTLTAHGLDSSTVYSEITGAGSIAFYRRGGSFGDGYYRLVGRAANPGAGGTVTFTDNASDQSINTAATIEFDNHPPVPSSLPIPLTGNILQYQPTGGGGAVTPPTTAGQAYRILIDTIPAGFVTLDVATPGTKSYISPGSTVQIGTGNSGETAILSLAGYVSSTSIWIEAWLQNPHLLFSADPSETIEVDAINRGKCDLVYQDFDCLFLAGDPNNPQVLCQSKVGRPESFPVFNLESNVAQQINVGSPANPIFGITSLNAELVVLNQNDINIVNVWQGQMQQPQKSASTRGLFAKRVFCKGANRIWFLAYDGIYTWAGGQAEKISEPIDLLFHNQTANEIFPIDMTKALKFSLEYANSRLFFVYIDTHGTYHRLCYEPIYTRWTSDVIYDQVPTPLLIDSMFTEPDTGRLLLGVTDPAPYHHLWWCDFYSTTDGWFGTPTDGWPIPYTMRTYWPLGESGADFQVGEIVLEMQNPGTGTSNDVTVETFYNYETVTIAEAMAVPTDTLHKRGRFIRTVNNGTPVTAYSMGLQILGSSGTVALAVPKFFTFTWRAFRLEEVTTGPASDWDDLGYPYDKYLYDVVIQYDTGGQSIPVSLDTISGITGSTETDAVATFTLSGAQRSQRVFAIPDQTVAKMIRLRPTFNSALKQFKFWKYTFRKDDYPPDVVVSTAWDDDGYPLDKYAQEIMIEADTANQIVPVQIQADGVTLQTVSVQTTTTDRHRNITLLPNLIGRQWRILVNTAAIPGGGKFQLFKAKFQFQKADKGPVNHTFDWDDLGTPYDKLLQTVSFEFDTTVGGTFTIQMDTLTGIDGNTPGTATQTFVLPAGGRGRKTFAVNTGIIVKMVRMYPVTDNVGSKTWSYAFQKIDYPADIVLFTDWADDGYPLDKYAQELLLEVDTANQIVPVQIMADGTTLQTVSVQTTGNNRHRNITLSPNLIGRQWRLVVDPTLIPAGGKFQLFKYKFEFQKADKGPVGHTFDWDDLGIPFDKMLQVVSFEFDTTVGGSFSIQMDTLSGINGNTLGTATQTFALPAGGRGRKTFAINDDTIIKMVRMYPVSDNIGSKTWSYAFQKIDYPPDTVLFTDWSDNGDPFDKYAQEVIIECDTAGQIVPVQIQADGATLQTVSVQATWNDRHRNLTLLPNLMGKQWRLLVNPGVIPAGGKFQLFKSTFQFQKADRGPVNHTFDWDDLGHPYDKLLQNVTIDFDTTTGGALTVNMDTLSGISGNTVTLIKQTFILPAGGRGKKTFAVNVDTLVKMVRMYPSSDTVTSKQWGYIFKKIDYPADTVFFTDYTDSGYPCDKTYQWLDIQVDTGGVPASVQFQVDGSVRYTFSVTGTELNRAFIITLPSDIMGKQWRIVATPGAGGKFQLFGLTPKYEPEPCAITHFDSLWQKFGAAGFSFIKQIWVDYVCPVPVIVSVYRDGGALFYQITLPAQPIRALQRYYVPAISGGQFNKSKEYRFKIDAQDGTTPFRMYRDGSRVETRNLGNDQRGGYLQHELSENMPLVA